MFLWGSLGIRGLCGGGEVIGSSLGASPTPTIQAFNPSLPSGLLQRSKRHRSLHGGGAARGRGRSPPPCSFPSAPQFTQPLIRSVFSLSHQAFPFVQFWSLPLQFSLFVFSLYCLLGKRGPPLDKSAPSLNLRLILGGAGLKDLLPSKNTDFAWGWGQRLSQGK